MILVDAIYINNSGGKILLDYLIKNLEESNLQIVYLLDLRIKDKIPNIKNTNKVVFLNNKLLTRYKFYLLNKIKFNKILCFGNIPPPIKVNSTVYTYFHQLLFLEKISNLKYLDKFKLFLKKIYLKFIIKNSNFWVVQTNNVKIKFIKQFDNVNIDSILIFPFYPQVNQYNKVTKLKNSFIYPSTGYSYKNQFNLINAFIKFYIKYNLGELHLTVSKDFPTIINLITNYQNEGYPIINHGFIKRDNLFELYASTEFVIYPSLAESFGISILESIDFNCKIIASDLPYTHAVCIPSLVFNPNSIDSIYQAFEESTQFKIKNSIKLFNNEIKPFINILS